MEPEQAAILDEASQDQEDVTERLAAMREAEARQEKRGRNYRAVGSSPKPPVYGPRKPLRDVRAELQG
jgi:hypothetical protein